MALGAFAACGIEIEYAIVDNASLDVRPLAGPLLRELSTGAPASCGNPAADWSNELVSHVVELKNPAPVADLRELPRAFADAVVRANACLDAQDARLMPTGMHPWMDPAFETRLWDAEGAPVYAAFDRVFDCRRHGWANLQSMHVNLPFEGDAEFARLHAAIRAVLPIIPALAASSPLAEGRRQGALDHRLVVYRDNSARFPAITGDVIPEDATSRAGYEQDVLAPMYRAIAPHDPNGMLQHEWLNARGAIARFDRSAIEIRVCDTQECPRADLGVAAAVIAVVRMLYEERTSDAARQGALPTGLLAAQLDGCVRDADEAPILNAKYGALFGVDASTMTAGQLWHRLLDRCGDGAVALNPHAAEPLAVLDAQGPLARRMLGALGEGFDRVRLRSLYGHLCECLATDSLFESA